MTYKVAIGFGRYGNCIQQVMNGILLAEYHQTNFIQPTEHEIISKFELSFGNQQEELNVGRYFFWRDWYNTTTREVKEPKDFDLGEEYVFKNARRICKNYIYPYLKLNIDESFDDDTIVIHLRSGDLYHNFNDPINYVPNPLVFYLNLIEKFKKVLVVTENDKLNPFIEIFEKIDKVKIQSTSLANDLSTLMRAKHLALPGVTTFSMAAGLCSHNITDLYCTNIKCNENLNHTMFYTTDVKVHEKTLEKYINVPCYENPEGGWTNSSEQRQFLLSYGLINKYKDLDFWNKQ
jgi:hypothetical protein